MQLLTKNNFLNNKKRLQEQGPQGIVMSNKGHLSYWKFYLTRNFLAIISENIYLQQSNANIYKNIVAKVFHELILVLKTKY